MIERISQAERASQAEKKKYKKTPDKLGLLKGINGREIVLSDTAMNKLLRGIGRSIGEYQRQIRETQKILKENKIIKKVKIKEFPHGKVPPDAPDEAFWLEDPRSGKVHLVVELTLTSGMRERRENNLKHLRELVDQSLILQAQYSID